MLDHFIFHILTQGLLIGIIVYFTQPNRKKTIKIALLILAANLIDLDHLIADPIYDPDRCSLTSHPLHSVVMYPLYVLSLFIKRTQLIGAGIIAHLIVDGIDCVV